MRYTDNVVDIRESELQELVHDNTAWIREPKERVICEAGLEAHGARVDDGLVAHGGEGLVAMNDRDPFAQHDRSEDGEESIDSWRGGFLEDDHHGHMVYLQTVG